MNLKPSPILIAAAVAALVVAAGAQAEERIVLASLGDVNGKVMINQGKGFVAARAGMEVRDGDRVIALEGAAAKIVYKDGCVTSLKERNLLPVDAKGCAKQPMNPGAEVVKLAQAIGTNTAKADVTPGDRKGSPPEKLPAGTPAWTTVAAGAGLVLAAGLFMGGVDKKPISAN